MNKQLILVIAVFALLTSCKNSKKETKTTEDTSEIKENRPSINQEEYKAYTLMKTNCYACHNPNAKSHDDILAPPFRAVKMHYTNEYKNKEDFVKAVVNWVQHPEEDKALMFGAVKRFKVMPVLPLPPKDLELIASYIYDNDVEEPDWMEEHMKEMQGEMRTMNNKANLDKEQ